MSDLSAKVWDHLQDLRKMTPVTHNITNYVVMNSTANALLAVGAAPIMAHSVDEMDDIVQIAHALVVNIGTLSAPWIDVRLPRLDTACLAGDE